MAAGPVPKAQHQRERDTKRRQSDIQTVTDDGELRGPPLEGPYAAQTLSWYNTWRRAPQAQLFEATDWSRLQLLAPIVEGYFRRPSAAALSEIRLNEERLGATVVDRLRAKIRVQKDESPDLAIVSSISSAGRTDVTARLRGQKP